MASANDGTDEDDRTDSGGLQSNGNQTGGATGAGTADMALLGHALSTGDENLLKRYQVARYAGMSFGGDRDYYETLGYDRDPDPEEYLAKYLRNGIARNIVNAPAATSWRVRPHVVDDADEGDETDAETEFEQGVKSLFEDYRLLHYLKRWDKALGLGEYGLLFLGTREPVDEDERQPDLDTALESGSLDPIQTDTTGEGDDGGLAYLATFTQNRVEDIDMVDDPRDPRYGLPEYYDLEFVSDGIERTERVHYTRVLHAAEGLLENEVFGRPRLQAVLNRLEDLEKVVGGSAEMFWRGAKRTLHLNYTGDGSPQDAEDLREQAEQYAHDMRDVLKTSNVEAQDLGGDAPDPSGNVEQLLKLIAGGTEPRIPVRMLVGSERGELASTQDRAEWLSRITERQEQFCEPMLLRPLLDRLVEIGVLPEPRGGGYAVEWPDLFELTELERAELRSKQAQALKNAGSQSSRAIATPAEIRERVFDWDPERGSEMTGTDAEVRESEAEDEGGIIPDDGEQTEFEDLFGDLRGAAQDGVTLDRDRDRDRADDDGRESGDTAVADALAAAADIPDTQDLDALYTAYNDRRNMSASDLERWTETTCFEDYASSSAGDPRGAVERNMRLIEREKDEWTAQDRRDAVRMLAYHARHGAQDSSATVSAECDLSPSTAGQISWAFDPTGRYS